MTRLVTFSDGTTVPVLGQGAWEIGDDPARRDAEQAALARGIDLGLTVIDTAELYGDDRVTVIENLPDALDHAAQLADEEGVGGGVLATGSVITAAEVRMLLGVTNS